MSAQTVDTGVLGTVADPSGAVVAGARVTVTQAAIGVSRSVIVGADGKYDFRYLAPGEYIVEVGAPGFRTERRTGLVVQIGQQAGLDFTLQLGDVQQTVEVKAVSPLLETENATQG